MIHGAHAVIYSTDAEADRANALSIAASHAIAGVKGGAFNMADAESGLMGAVRDGAPDDVRLAALGALRNIASADSAGALAAMAARTENSDAVRAAAARAHVRRAARPLGGEGAPRRLALRRSAPRRRAERDPPWPCLQRVP